MIMAQINPNKGNWYRKFFRMDRFARRFFSKKISRSLVRNEKKIARKKVRQYFKTTLNKKEWEINDYE